MRSTTSMFAGLLMLTSCSFSGQWQDENIDPKIRGEIAELNLQIIDGLARTDPEKLRSVASEKLLEHANAMDSMVTSGRWKIDPSKFKIKNQFYLKKSAGGTDSRVFSGLTEDHDYAISFKAINKEMFVSVGYVENGVESLALTMIYGRYGDNWKLNILQIGIMKIEGKDAVDWYRRAQSNYDRGNLVDASISYTLVTQCVKPANQFWEYNLEKEMKNFGKKLDTAINNAYVFPVTIPISSKPEIFRIFPQMTNEGVYPSVLYTTKLGMKDTTALANECTAIHKNIGQVFKGFDLGKKYIYYRAFEALPTGKEEVRNYGFTRKGEK